MSNQPPQDPQLSDHGHQPQTASEKVQPPWYKMGKVKTLLIVVGATLFVLLIGIPFAVGFIEGVKGGSSPSDTPTSDPSDYDVSVVPNKDTAAYEDGYRAGLSLSAGDALEAFDLCGQAGDASYGVGTASSNEATLGCVDGWNDQ
jgi:hypothetical protein